MSRWRRRAYEILEALYAERRALFGCVVILFGATLITASFIHLAERDAQPDKFGTIPDAMWWAIVTLGTIGYGDAVPVTPLGKLVAAVTIMCGLVMIALPVGIITNAFSDQIHRRDFVVTWGMVARVPLFNGLDATALAQIMRLLRAQTANAGDIIVRRGDAAHSMYFIANGEVGVELEQRAHGWRVAGELEEAHDPQQQDDAKLGRHHEGEPERQDRDEIDEAVGGQDVAQPRAGRRHLAGRRVLRRHPDAQRIFQCEDDDRNHLDGDEDALIGGFVAGDGFEHHGGDIDEHEQDQEPAHDPLPPVAHRTVLEDLIGAAAPPRHALRLMRLGLMRHVSSSPLPRCAEIRLLSLPEFVVAAVGMWATLLRCPSVAACP